MKENVLAFADVDGDREVPCGSEVHEQQTESEGVGLAEIVELQGLNFLFDAFNERPQCRLGLLVWRVRVKFRFG